MDVTYKKGRRGTFMLEQEKQIQLFLDKKNIKEETHREAITEYIKKHTQIYGNQIPIEAFIQRLDENLSQIELKNPSESDTKDTVGKYEGFDKNTITMYFTKEHLQNPVLRNDYVQILQHELTHCAYNKKNKDIYHSESQVFNKMEKLSDGRVVRVEGDGILWEPMINYIASRVTGTKNSAYVPQTNEMYQLVEHIEEDKMIKAAWDSKEEALESQFEKISPHAYHTFKSGINSLNHNNPIMAKNNLDKFYDMARQKGMTHSHPREFIKQSSLQTQDLKENTSKQQTGMVPFKQSIFSKIFSTVKEKLHHITDKFQNKKSQIPDLSSHHSSPTRIEENIQESLFFKELKGNIQKPDHFKEYDRNQRDVREKEGKDDPTIPSL